VSEWQLNFSSRSLRQLDCFLSALSRDVWLLIPGIHPTPRTQEKRQEHQTFKFPGVRR
jgi:hypothetical protein